MGTQTSMSENFYCQVRDNSGSVSKISCLWRPSKPSHGRTEESQYVNCLDLAVRISAELPDRISGSEDGVVATSLGCISTDSALGRIVHACYKIRSSPAQQEIEANLKIILAPRNGYLCRTDILELRMRHAESVETVIPLQVTDGYFPSVQNYPTDLQTMLLSSPGALLARKQPDASFQEIMTSLEQDVEKRLSFHWSMPAKPVARKVAVIGGRAMFDPNAMSSCYEGPYEAARALGISLLVVDRPGHWLQDEMYTLLREEFVAIDITIDDELPSRIANAVKGKGIDGIVAFADEFVEATAQAAEELGLPTEPVTAYLQSLNKHTTRKMVDIEAQSLVLDSGGQIEDLATILEVKSLQFPLVVKPCRGGGSRGVRKVNDLESLQTAVREAEDNDYSKQGVLVEPYISGPEVDANFALLDGEILFFEMCDDFPCQADAEDATVAHNFAEDNMVLPSRLSIEETELIRSTLHDNLLLLGFRSGVFHVEARLQGSTMHYSESDGIVDLEFVSLGSVKTRSYQQNQVFLLEVNPRPAGPHCVWATTYTYGVDFYGLQLLRVINDSKRFAALCSPFVGGAQYHCANLMVPVHKENLHVPEDYCSLMLEKLPKISAFVSRVECFVPGKTVSKKGGVGFIAYFLVYNRLSRRELLGMCNHIKKASLEVLDRV